MNTVTTVKEWQDWLKKKEENGGLVNAPPQLQIMHIRYGRVPGKMCKDCDGFVWKQKRCERNPNSKWDGTWAACGLADEAWDE